MSQSTPQKEEIKIRKMVEADLKDVGHVDEIIQGEDRLPTWPFSFESYWNIYRPDIGLVAEIGGEVIGFVVGTIAEDEHSQSIFNLIHTTEPSARHRWIGWLDMIGICPEHRYKGVGRALMDAFYRECRQRNAVMRSIANESDQKLTSFLESMGFAKSKAVVYEKE